MVGGRAWVRGLPQMQLTNKQRAEKKSYVSKNTVLHWAISQHRKKAEKKDVEAFDLCANQEFLLMGNSTFPLRRPSHLVLIAIVASLGQDNFMRTNAGTGEVGRGLYVVIGIQEV